MSQHRRRVVVTGLGCVSPVGNDVSQSWTSLLTGQSGTVRYRYERICELTGDLSSPEKQVEISVALHLCRLNPDLCRPELPSPPLRSSPDRRGLG